MVSVEFEYLAGTVTIRVAGEVDLSSSPDLANHLSSARRDGNSPGEVVIDLTGVTFLDSSGISALVVFAAACANQGAALRVIPTAAIHRSFVITGLAEFLGSEKPVEKDAAGAAEDGEPGA